MGRATKWFNCVLCCLCIKKVEGHSGREGNEKLGSNPSTILPHITPTEAAWLPSSSNAAAANAVKTVGNSGTDENWIRSINSRNNLVEKEEEDEESLSFSDLPINEQNHHESRKGTITSPEPILDHQEGFSFHSWNDSSPKESDICIADDVFCQGQIKPVYSQSISSDSARVSNSTTGRCISMDHCSNSVSFTSVSSRSSSINSHHSSSCASLVASKAVPKNKPRPKIQGPFQFSQASPKPQIQSLEVKNGGRQTSTPYRKPTFWRFFRIGLMTTPDIAQQDLKFRIKSDASTKELW